MTAPNHLPTPTFLTCVSARRAEVSSPFGVPCNPKPETRFAKPLSFRRAMVQPLHLPTVRASHLPFPPTRQFKTHRP